MTLVWNFSPQVPFILVESKKWPHADYVVVNMEGSNHPLPLTTVYQHLQPISSTPYTFLQALCGLEYPVSFLLCNVCLVKLVLCCSYSKSPSGWNAL